jgi:RimJ/RimL family protein N-acetyltransferase
MKWRNEQIYHLRQSKELTIKEQDLYFDNVVANLFDVEFPSQILFSYLENDVCIGYGGLVHINWIDKNAEISFVLNTQLESAFIDHWCNFLYLIENVAFNEIGISKIYTYAFDLRPNLYLALEKSGFYHESTLINHSIFDGRFIDVVIHSKINNNSFYLRKADSYLDGLLLFNWVNDESVRKNSFNSDEISISDHFNWFKSKLNSKISQIYILSDLYKSNIGQIRVDMIDGYYEIDYSISNKFRGKGFGGLILKLLEEKLGQGSLLAKVKKANLPSVKIFKNNGFQILKEADNTIVFIKNFK